MLDKRILSIKQSLWQTSIFFYWTLWNHFKPFKYRLNVVTVYVHRFEGRKTQLFTTGLSSYKFCLNCTTCISHKSIKKTYNNTFDCQTFLLPGFSASFDLLSHAGLIVFRSNPFEVSFFLNCGYINQFAHTAVKVVFVKRKKTIKV